MLDSIFSPGTSVFIPEIFSIYIPDYQITDLIERVLLAATG